MRLQILGAAALSLALAACGTNERDRVQGGAAAGAATGAGVGAFGGPVGAAVGAVVGGGAGAVTGYTTSPSDVNLGKPVWRNPEVRTPLDENQRAGRRSATTRQSATRASARGNSDGAYMGGGMVVEPGGTPANPNPSAAPAMGGSSGMSSGTSSGTSMGTAPTPVNPAPRAMP
ncbi:hypothetical protein BKE38_27805 [Pseudoroseomonas deserti]|uniref:YMGG-like Gly-zipper domain-containing protein n=1 Tax=Teichococcus deserti TaxID=1817963 RepID=A0A1V2GTZ8_9PROT|nr:hypothetical protein [Pseudoroseomonas deserti]ONG44639.1 hypothetical protein BKE38_27805 [Pseudoroseomonas deserti]